MRLGTVIVGLSLLAGCSSEPESAPPPKVGGRTASSATPNGAPATVAGPSGTAEPQQGPTGAQPLPGVAIPGASGPDSSIGGLPMPVAPGTPPAPPASEFVPAQAGVGAKGRSLDEHEGIIVTPAKTLFAARERIAFEIAIPHALNLYKATNGEGPKTHEEFMQKIVAENQIKLPQLPAGHQYQYDPQTEQLMVKRPRKS